MLKWKALVPQAIKTRMRVAWRALSDLFHYGRRIFVPFLKKRIDEGCLFIEQIAIEQPINPSRWAAPKIHNINLAVSRFQNLAVYPDEIFSFWRLAGRPSQKNGYQKGINIIKDKLDFDVGGGLCQLSGLLYHLVLKAGLEVVERHPHSVDLYTDETRYTPLGSDATVVYGYKDLRIRNNLPHPVCFRIGVDGLKIRGSLCAPKSMEIYKVKFERKIFNGGKKVRTLLSRNGNDWMQVAESLYQDTKHNQII